MIRERVPNQGAISRHRLITEYNAFVMINKYDANDVFLYKQDSVHNNRAYYIRYSNDNNRRIAEALEAAVEFSPNVRGPFIIKEKSA